MSLTYVITCGVVTQAYTPPGLEAILGPGTYDHGWYVTTTLQAALLMALDGDAALGMNNNTTQLQAALARFAGGLIALNGGAAGPLSGLPAGFTPLTAQVDCSVSATPDSTDTIFLQFDSSTVSDAFTSANVTGNTVFSFVFPGVVPGVLDLFNGGMGLQQIQGYQSSPTQMYFDLLQISGTYKILGGSSYWDNPVTNHKRYSPTMPPGGNWKPTPAFVPDTVSILPVVGSTSGGDFVSISGINFDDSSAYNTTIGGNAITGGIVVNSNLITGYTAAHAAGVVNVVLTNQDGSTSTLVNGFTYAADQWWFIPPGTWWFGGPPVPPVIPAIPSTPPPAPQGTLPPADTQGWYWSNTGFAGGSFLALSPGNPQHARGWDKIVGFATEITSGNLGGLPSVNYQNTIIYAGDDYNLSSSNPTVRLFDGNADRLLVSIPNTPAGAVPNAIMSMLLVGTIVYISTYDSGTTNITFAGRVFAYDILAQTLTPIATGFSTGEIPYALAWHMDRLWVGTNRGDGTLGVVYWIRPNIDVAWTTETGTITGGVCALQSFGGKLFIGCSQIAGTFAKLYVRNSDATYTTGYAGSGGAAKENNGWLSLGVFNGNLYAGYWNPDSPLIAQVHEVNTSGVMTLVYTGATDTLTPYLAIFTSAGILYVLGCADEIQVSLISSPDGSTWTDLSTELNTLSGETAIPVFGTIGF